MNIIYVWLQETIPSLIAKTLDAFFISLLYMDINHTYQFYFVGTNAVNQLAKHLVLLY